MRITIRRTLMCSYPKDRQKGGAICQFILMYQYVYHPGA